jgi:hypothetical protein
MNRQQMATKRARTEQQDGAGGADNLPGREQLLITSPELQTRVGLRFVDETELVPLLLAHGLIRRVRTIQIEVRPLGGDSVKVTLDASKPTVADAKAEIARLQGTAAAQQDLYRVAERADGLAVREDDAEPEPLDDERMELEDGDVVAMAVKETPLLWRTFAEGSVTLSEGGAVATQHIINEEWSLTTTGTELTEGRHYWEVEVLSDKGILLGISRPNLDPTGQFHIGQEHHRTTGSSTPSMVLSTSTPFLNGEEASTPAASRAIVWACCSTLTTAPSISSRTAYSKSQASQRAT